MEEVPDSKRNTGSFEPAEGVKEILIDPDNSGDKKVRIGTTLSPNRKASSLTSSVPIKTSLRGSPRICQAYRENSPSMP
jgi:hypothetical protein